MDKIIGLGNALVDVLATLKDDTLLMKWVYPKEACSSSMTLSYSRLTQNFHR